MMTPSTAIKSLLPLLPARATAAAPSLPRTPFPLAPSSVHTRLFSASAVSASWLIPKGGESGKSRKGRPRVPTGGSTRGTTVVWGDYGLRLADHHRRLSAQQLKNAEDTIRKKLRGMKYRLYMRIAANMAVHTKGNEVRMGTGKGTFDYWSARVPVSRVVFELKGEVHEQLVRDAFRVASAKLPGLYEIVKRGDPPMMGTMKLTPENIEKLKARKDFSKIQYPLNKGLSANVSVAQL